jgi:hypothetical protein
MTAMNPWLDDGHGQTPGYERDPNRGADGVQALFYDGPVWKGKPTRIFAYYGAPRDAASGRVPAMVLVHGGGGSAFIPWVQLWVARGYAAIAMDTCGCISGGGYENHPRHETGGPPGWGGFDQIDEPETDQWPYHAVAAVLRAHSLIRSFPEVDPGRVGITGISWGGYLTCIAAGVDPRFRLAAPVYGCGYIGDNSVWLETFQKMGVDRARRWLERWDPAVYLAGARMPFLWVTGTNDFAYPLDSLQKSYRRPAGERTLCVRVRMPHGHGGAGENPEEIRVFADSVLAGGAGLCRVGRVSRVGRRVECAFDDAGAIRNAELIYTRDRGKWPDRSWETGPAEIDFAARRLVAEVPAGTAAYYLNFLDDRSCVVSSEHEELDE